MKYFALCLSAFLANPLLAVIVTPLSIQDLVAKAQLIIHGTVQRKTCQRDPSGRIYTKVEVQIEDVWKGTPSRNPLPIVHGGGTVGEEQVVVSGQVDYTVGEEVVAFLVVNHRHEAVTIGLAQGKFHVWKDQASGKRFARNPFHGADLTSAAPNASVRAAPLALSALKAQVRGAVK